MTKLDSTFKKLCFLRYTSGVKSYVLWNLVARKVIVSSDVSFNEPGLLKEGENFESSRIDKEKYPIMDVVMREFDHYVTNHMSYEVAPVHQE